MLKNFQTYQLAVALYKACEKLKLYGPLREQLRRATASIALNLAEGSAKPTSKDRSKYYHIALGSIREVQSIMDLIENKELATQTDQLAATCYCLCRSYR